MLGNIRTKEHAVKGLNTREDLHVKKQNLKKIYSFPQILRFLCAKNVIEKCEAIIYSIFIKTICLDLLTPFLGFVLVPMISLLWQIHVVNITNKNGRKFYFSI